MVRRAGGRHRFCFDLHVARRRGRRRSATSTKDRQAATVDGVATWEKWNVVFIYFGIKCCSQSRRKLWISFESLLNFSIVLICRLKVAAFFKNVGKVLRNVGKPKRFKYRIIHFIHRKILNRKRKQSWQKSRKFPISILNKKICSFWMFPLAYQYFPIPYWIISLESTW